MVNPSFRLRNSFMLAVSVKHTRAMLASTLSRNSRPELIADDGQSGSSGRVLQLGSGPTNGRRRPGLGLPEVTTHPIDIFRMPLKTHSRAPSI